MRTVITFGTFDLFHIGHLRILTRARQFGDRLAVGVSTDALNVAKKSFLPVFGCADRMEIIQALDCVDTVFAEESLDLKGEYISQHQASILVMGDDWQGKFDGFKSQCEVIYLPRTAGISSTWIKEHIIRAGSQAFV
jgi:glycerol-3-phosphate cytidylyltransferase